MVIPPTPDGMVVIDTVLPNAPILSGPATIDSLNISPVAGTTGSLLIAPGGSLTLGANAFIGDGGTGTLTINGSMANFYGFIGGAATGKGTVIVDGSDALWNNRIGLTLGRDGSGSLLLTNGGTVTINGGSGTLDIADRAGSRGNLIIGADYHYAAAAPGVLNAANISFGAGTGVIDFNHTSNSYVFSPDMGGKGYLTFWNGTTILTGDSSAFTGDLTVTNGTMQISAGGKLGGNEALLGTHTDNATAIVTGTGSSWSPSTLTVAGDTSTATLRILEGGTVTNQTAVVGSQSGANGAVLVSGDQSAWRVNGQAHIGAAGFGSLTVADNGTFQIGNGAGIVSVAEQAGSIGEINIGGLPQSAAVAAGKIEASAIAFGDGAGSLNFNHTSQSYIFAPSLTGKGAINVKAGMTTLTADSHTFTGTTQIEGGTLSVNGTLGGTLDVLSAGRLQGNGTVGAVNANGVIAPGNSIGTLNVSSILFNPNSIYEVEVNAAGQSDRIAATGNATINGGTVRVLAGSGDYAPSTTYTILTAAGGRAGTFSDVTSNFAFLSPSLTYDPDSVYLTLTRNNVDFENVGLTRNQRATGKGVGSLTAGNPVWDAVVQLDAPGARYAFDQLSGEVHASARTALIEDSRFLRNAVNERLRSAFDGVGASGGAAVTYKDGKPKVAMAGTDGLAFWGQGFGSWGHTSSDGNAARLNRSTGGFFIGADTPVFDTWRFGAVAGYSRTNFDVKDRYSSGSSDNYHLGLYGGTSWGDLAFRTGAAYTWHDISTSRNVMFSGFGDSLKGDYNAGTTQVFGEFGYGVTVGAARFEPFANLAYVNLHTDGFTEKGGAAALTSASANTDATFTTLGLRGSTTFDLNGAGVTAKGMIGWRHAFGNVTPLSSMRFAGGDAFTIAGVPITRDAAVVEAGLDFALTPNATLGVSYGGQFGNGFQDQSVKGNLAVRF